MRGIRIAVDGPAASGKGTAARGVARALGYLHLDTGALYRAAGVLAREAGVDLDDGPSVARVVRGADLRWQPGPSGSLDLYAGDRRLEPLLRTARAGEDASRVAARPEVRAALLDLQRSLAAEGGVVLDGRDIGTVVLPDAELKVYLDASPAERARRRWAEYRARGVEVPLEAVERELAGRDRRDRGRAAAPLLVADDAVRIDTTGLSPEEVVAAIVERALERGARRPGDVDEAPRLG